MRCRELVNRKISAVKQAIGMHRKIKLKDLKIYDLLFDGRGQTDSVHGVYLFFEKKKCLYIGKASGREFIERIPDHFALREEAWMNYFLKRYRDNEAIKTLWDAAKAAKNCSILVISVDEHECISKFEKLLRLIFQPAFNRPSMRMIESAEVNDNELFCEVMERI